jgi:hypothetical protein
MLLLAAIFFAGVLHGLGPDHLAAITAFGAAGGRDARRVTFFSTRFALGHAAVIAAAGLLGKFGRLLLPALWERRFEVASGWLLVFTGVVLLVGVMTGRISLHAHPHQHGPGPHRHFHMHWFGSQRHQHAHGAGAAVLGALFALGGVRGLLAVVPIALAQTLAISLLRIGAFVIGIIVTMVSYGLFTQQLIGRANSTRWLQATSYCAALFCVGAGILVIQGRI